MNLNTIYVFILAGFYFAYTTQSASTQTKLKPIIKNEKGISYAGVYYGKSNSYEANALIVTPQLRFLYARGNCDYAGHFSKPTLGEDGAKSILWVKKAVSKTSAPCGIERGRYECSLRISNIHFMALCGGLGRFKDLERTGPSVPLTLSLILERQ